MVGSFSIFTHRYYGLGWLLTTNLVSATCHISSTIRPWDLFR